MKIVRANFLEDFVLELELSNKEKVHYDLKPHLNTARFRNITTQSFFEKGKLVDQCYIYWDEVTELQDYEILGEEYIKMNL